MSVHEGRELAQLIDSTNSGLGQVRAFLDDLAADQRLAAVRSLGPQQQRALFGLAEGFMPLKLTDLVPAAQPALSPVRHFGRNSMPLFKYFEKRFYRQRDGDSDLAGANFQSLSPLTGAGYYVAREDSERGEVLIDYTQVPEIPPPGWPEITRNERGVSRLVYGFMVDTLRRVSEHVTIGRAARHGKPMNAWFLLCREA
ncbi:MAG: hypothetical protein OXU20_26605 [Myxococcales bacterium]|nr:hypothetical protein [Myxococcales bacterium]MDD9967800.1 hypothetical protein [Myxococcales bacterium]